MHGSSDRDVNWMSPVQGKSPPVQVKEPYNFVCVYGGGGSFVNCLSSDKKSVWPYET